MEEEIGEAYISLPKMLNGSRWNAHHAAIAALPVIKAHDHLAIAPLTAACANYRVHQQLPRLFITLLDTVRDGPHQLSMVRLPRQRDADEAGGKPLVTERYGIPFWIDRSGGE
jgi:hypothetical protein